MKKIIVVALIGVAAFAFAPKYSGSELVKLTQVQTTGSKTYPAGTRQGGAWFVEMVK